MCPGVWEESLRPAAAGALARRLPAVLRGGPVADPPRCRLISPVGCPRPRRHAPRSAATRVPLPAGSPGRPSPRLRGTGRAPRSGRLWTFSTSRPRRAVPDRLLADLSVPAVLRDVVLPYLADLGERWQRATASVAMEHFASNLIRGRLAGLARGWGSRHGPQALLACPPELHDTTLTVFGICTPQQRLADRLSRSEHPGRGAGAGRRLLAS